MLNRHFDIFINKKTIASWSSIEYSGKWKLLHYAAKDFFNRVRVVLIKKDGTIYLNAVNESLCPVEAEITLRIMDFDGTDATKKFVLKKRLGSDTSENLWETAIDKLKLKDLNKYFIYAELKAKTLSGKKQTLTFAPSTYGTEKEIRTPSTTAFRRTLKIYNLRETYE